MRSSSKVRTLSVLAVCAAMAVIAPPAADAATKTLNERLLAAAEPFEVLTESAFDEVPEELKKLAVEAAAELAKLGDQAGAELRGGLKLRSAELAKAFASNDRPGIAIAAVESYRLLVMAQDATAKIPPAVKLLDYAGFKVDALVKARPTDWAMVGEVMSLAKETWGGLAERVKDAKLRDAFTYALQAMVAATAVRDSAAALLAEKQESDLVDKLEAYFREKT